ncbi:MAG: putative membrane protein [Candidatus Methanohalarchaeum thermophilum]|uniref:Membrane protein n=1 Tax=Methanohalarchaeum thermophilum TaxID=1903181 RepID=A0A1Q6DVG2_METT1|nr:MAG: putative membrane protein [Candidatus Methanohalarchaeum thermophilum]
MSLRLLEVYHPKTTDRVKDILSDIPFIDIKEEVKSIEEGEIVVSRILLDAKQSEEAIDILKNKLKGFEEFRINIYPIEASIPRPEKGEREWELEKKSDRVSMEELYQNITDETEVSNQYIVTVAIAAIVASVGVLYNDVAVIIGSMVIAPLFTPSMGLSLATSLGDYKLAKKSIKTAVVGFLIPILIGIIFGLLFEINKSSPQIASRTSINLLYILLAISSGIAGSLSTTKGVSQALVGVMIAVALLPPLVVFGILAGATYWIPAFGSGLLFLVNFVGINLAGVITFAFQKIWPEKWWEKRKAKKTVRKVIVIWIILILILALLIQVYRTYFLVPP